MKQVILKRGKEAPVRRRSPFIFSGAVGRTDDGLADGDPVRVCTHDGQPLATGHYQSGGSIRVRVLSFGDRALDRDFWRGAVRDAWRLRESLGLVENPETNAFRLVHGEGDGLPGLIVDWYNGYAVVEPHSAGMARAAADIRDAVAHAAGDTLRGIHVKERKADAVQDASLPGHTEIRENGLRFLVDWEHGQKTGFFLDQRENRALLQRYAAERRVLNLFSYSGAFSVYALGAGAERVCSVDSSAPALVWAGENIRRNGLDAARHTSATADVFDWLKASDVRWDTVVCDPPAFAKHMSARHDAIQAYRRLNAMALRAVEPGGILFTFSCSQVVTPDLFRGALFAAAVDVGRPVRMLHQLHQPPDHPVSIYHPESEYLKGLVLHVS